MEIEPRDVIALSDGNQYVVVSKGTVNNIVYYCISDINNDDNMKICAQDNGELRLVQDSKELDAAIVCLGKNISSFSE